MAADPTMISSIADAAGELFKLGGKITAAVTKRTNTYLDLLRGEGAPRLKDIYADLKEQDRLEIEQNTRIIQMLTIGLIVIIVVALWRDKGAKE